MWGIMYFNNEMRLFTSESVTEGHPDKVCDLIADTVLDAVIEGDPEARVAVECMATRGLVVLGGEVSSKSVYDVQELCRTAIRYCGYDKPGYGFDADSCAVISTIKRQSEDIAMGVDRAFEIRDDNCSSSDLNDEELSIGAGDQGMVFGYASDETENYMPLSIDLAHSLTRRLARVRKEGILKGLRPDGKAQVTVSYEGDEVKGVEAVVLSAQHDPDYEISRLREDLKQNVIKTVIPKELLSEKTKFYINPTGRFVYGGPAADTGLTGRKIIVDTYGGVSSHGGGSFSGKDPTKVDRSASYAARYIAKNLVAAGVCRRIEIQIAYSIGVARPVSISAETFGTGRLSENEIIGLIRKHFSLTPEGIIKMLDLRRPIYKKTTNYGHFGRNEEGLLWEKTDKAETIRKEVFHTGVN